MVVIVSIVSVSSAVNGIHCVVQSSILFLTLMESVINNS